MGKWLERFNAGTSIKSEESTQPYCHIVDIVTPISELIEELNHLNQRWQKADALEKAGHFTGKSQEYEEKICYELRQICGRATDIWEFLSEKQPDSLIGLYLLYANETKGEA